MIRRLFTITCAASFSAIGLHAQASKGVLLELRGLSSSRSVAAADLARLPRHTVKASAPEVSGEFSGVSLSDLLHLVGAPSGDSLRGKELADYVVVDARDGYRVVFALAELDAGFTNRIAVLADHMDGKAIDSRNGPLRLVVPDEKRAARWVRQVSRISLMPVLYEMAARPRDHLEV
jgi:DMSO/TMAO reductase YedYZ molybdopterin-dependent catalytic subunit